MEKAESTFEPLHATANGVAMLIKVRSLSEDLANAANPDLRWQFMWYPEFETDKDGGGSVSSSPHPGSVINQTPGRAQDLSLVPDSLERGKAQAEKDLELYADEQAKPFQKSKNFRKSLIDQATLYKRMGLGFPESSDVYAAGIGEDWQAVLDRETVPKTAAPRGESPANYPGKGLAPKMASLGSSPGPESPSMVVQVDIPEGFPDLSEGSPAMFRWAMQNIKGSWPTPAIGGNVEVTRKGLDHTASQTRRNPKKMRVIAALPQLLEAARQVVEPNGKRIQIHALAMLDGEPQLVKITVEKRGGVTNVNHGLDSMTSRGLK